MNTLCATFAPITHEAYEIKAARYAEGKVAVRCLDSVGGMRGRASRLLSAIAPGARHSGREKATICSPAQSRKFVEAFATGEDGFLGDRNGILGWVREASAPAA